MVLSSPVKQQYFLVGLSQRQTECLWQSEELVEQQQSLARTLEFELFDCCSSPGHLFIEAAEKAHTGSFHTEGAKAAFWAGCFMGSGVLLQKEIHGDTGV